MNFEQAMAVADTFKSTSGMRYLGYSFLYNCVFNPPPSKAFTIWTEKKYIPKEQGFAEWWGMYCISDEGYEGWQKRDHMFEAFKAGVNFAINNLP